MLNLTGTSQISWIPKYAQHLSICLLVISSFASSANDTVPIKASLEVSPERCVALHKGQTCYLDAEFRWQTDREGNYCLYNKTLNKAVNCWQAQKTGKYSLDFQAAENHQFSLRASQSTDELAVTQITVAWVYKSTKRAKSSWRLF